MVSLNVPLDLLGKRKGSTFLGISESTNSQYCIVTFNTSVTLLELAESKVIKSWACTKGRKNTSTAVYAPQENEFVLVQNENVLRTFKESDYEDAQTFSLNHKICMLVRCEGRNPIVMLEDGSVHHLHYVLANPKEIRPNREVDVKIDEIFIVSSFLHGKSINVFTVCSVKEEHHVLLASLGDDENEAKYHHKRLQYGDCTLMAASVYDKSKSPCFVTVWDDGSVCLLKADLNGAEEQELSISLEKIGSVEIGSNTSVTCISQDCAAVLCKGPSLAILNLKFGTTLFTRPTGEATTQLSVVKNFLILDNPGKLQKVQFTASPITLANTILKRRQVCAGKQVMQFAKWSGETTNVQQLSKKDSELIDTLLNTVEEKDFEESWTTFWSDKSDHFREHLAVSEVMRLILERFGTKESQKFWPRSTILEIVNSGLMNGRWCDGVFRRALAEKDWSLLLDCLNQLNDVSEEVMISCIMHITRFLDSGTDLVNGDVHENARSFPQQLTLCLNQIFQLPFSENVLRTELASLPFSSVMFLVEYLTRQMKELSLASTQPTLEQTINWLSMLLDTHLSEIIMLEKAWPAIGILHEAVKTQSLLFKELSYVDKLLSQIESKLITSKRSKDFLYSVQIMEF